MDIIGSFPNLTRQYWLYAIVRSPHAGRYNESDTRNASYTVGYAASEGANKWDNYKSQLVVPMNYESYGRLGPESISCLEEIAANGASVSTPVHYYSHVSSKLAKGMSNGPLPTCPWHPWDEVGPGPKQLLPVAPLANGHEHLAPTFLLLLEPRVRRGVLRLRVKPVGC